MAKEIKIGTPVFYRLNGENKLRKACVEEIEVCEDGEKYGEGTDRISWKDKDNCTFSLDDGHWCYGDQIKMIAN